MLFFDGHVHCDTADKAEWKTFIREIEKLEMRAVVCYGPSNEVVLECANSAPDHLVAYAHFNLWDKVDANEVYRFKEQGFKGLKFIEPYYEYDHDLYMPVYAAAEELNMPVLFHTGLFRPEPGHIIHQRPLIKNMQPLTIDRIARSFQKLNIVMAHMGTSLYRHEAAELMLNHPNVYADLAGCGSWLAVQATELHQLLTPSNKEIDVSFAGFKKLILGSDAYVTKPFILKMARDNYLHTLERAAVPHEIKEQIMGGTLASWLD